MFLHHYSLVVHNPQLHTFSPFTIFPSTTTPRIFQPLQTLNFPLNRNLRSLYSYPPHQDDYSEENVIGNRVIFEEGIFEDSIFQKDLNLDANKPKPKRNDNDLVPDEWRKAQAEIHIKKEDSRKIARKIEFNSKVNKKKKKRELVPVKRRGLVPLRNMTLDEYTAYKEAKLARLKPLVLDEPPSFSFAEKEEVSEGELSVGADGERVKPKNPRLAVYGRSLDDVEEFFNSEKYNPAAAKSNEGCPELFTKEEEDLLRRKPDLAVATSDKWLPLHTIAASGESFLLDSLLKHDVDINAADKDGLTALHKAIIGKNQSITKCLLRNSANPFVQDKDGATLMHYAVQTAALAIIKVLLFYDVDINLQDNDGWTPLHLAVQTHRTDVVKLLLIKGADKKLKNKDGLTPLDLCLYSGQSVRTYQLIRSLKRRRSRGKNKRQMGIRNNTTFERIELASDGGEKKPKPTGIHG